ncbi:LOW QUALITY PROTEIN: cilia-and flagella-associated protein 96 [Trachinotus anak]|uniref:LOW QUALITY PROTEIN: cilia-and flagella-associated protein 96 n=1 Tax=Trachinotus anak TaxID=443729 RepID=UPI0039F253AB
MPSAEGKTDMERLGVFKEMSYIFKGDNYTPPTCPFNESFYRSQQRLRWTCMAQQRCALQSGFFNKSFKRIFECEALSDPLRLARQNHIQQAKKNLGKAFLPSNSVKKPCGSGSYYGTLSGPLEAMSPLTVTWKAHRSPGRNIITSPPKKGSGYSYPNVTLSRPELYVSEPYDRAREALKKEAVIQHSRFRDGPFKLNLHPTDYFQVNPYHGDQPLPPAHRPTPPSQSLSAVPFKPPSPSKRAGGMKAGTFDSYPSHSADPFITHRHKPSINKPVFRPTAGPKSTPVKSIITINVNRSVHSTNYTSTVPAVMTL